MMDEEARRKVFVFVIQTGIRLEAKNSTICTASVLTYRVLRKELSSEICPYVCNVWNNLLAEVGLYPILTKFISYLDELPSHMLTLACACMLLAAKVEEDQEVRLRDVLNVAHSVLHPNEPLLQIGEQLWEMREGIARMEYVVLRILRFRLYVENPHKYLLQYVSSLRHWYPREFCSEGIPEISFILLRDAHVCPEWVLSHNAQTIAIVCLAVALRVSKVDLDTRWYSVFCTSMNRSKLRRLEDEFLSKALKR